MPHSQYTRLLSGEIGVRTPAAHPVGAQLVVQIDPDQQIIPRAENVLVIHAGPDYSLCELQPNAAQAA